MKTFKINREIGISRQLDNLGRIVIPKEYRKQFNIKSNNRFSVLAAELEDGEIVFVLRFEQDK